MSTHKRLHRLFASLAADNSPQVPYSRDIADQRRKYGESMLRRCEEHLSTQKQYEAEAQAKIEAARQRLRERGIDRLMIQVLQSRPELRAWYERRGFEATGQVLPFPATGLKVAGLRMDVLVAPVD